ncbi:MAG: hypothetical protein Q8831_02730 ['Bonamia sp.' little leaf phytoplasma]|nr:hypothetical protein ['Bonamia sp.' little leaf phytoplasma]
MESGVLGNLLAPFGRGLLVIVDENKSYRRNANNLFVFVMKKIYLNHQKSTYIIKIQKKIYIKKVQKIKMFILILKNKF